ncbi:MAG: glycosyltransferase [Saprospirales bacterium]|nr:MAG: glycosyltransferase [Saprospirales bacterium]
MATDNPMVSIAMITFNHEKFISEAIEGVLRQKTDFAIELLVGEDGSADRTRELCQKYADSFPEKVKLLPFSNRLGMMDNLLNVFNNCSGKYIAFCEGDDYWTDSQKLQKQFDFMESNPDVFYSFHQSSILMGDKIIGKRPLSGSGFLKMEDLLYRKTYPSLSLFYRNTDNIHSEFSKLSPFFLTADFPLVLLLASKGRGYLFPDNMGVYRLHSGGIYSQLSEIKKLQSGIQNRRAALRHIPMNFRQKMICRLMIYLRWAKIFLLKIKGK